MKEDDGPSLWSIHVKGSFVTQILLLGPYMMWMARTSVDILDVVACLTVLPVLPCPAEIPAMQPCLHFREEISYFQDQSFLGRS